MLCISCNIAMDDSVHSLFVAIFRSVLNFGDCHFTATGYAKLCKKSFLLGRTNWLLGSSRLLVSVCGGIVHHVFTCRCFAKG